MVVGLVEIVVVIVGEDIGTQTLLIQLSLQVALSDARLH